MARREGPGYVAPDEEEERLGGPEEGAGYVAPDDDTGIDWDWVSEDRDERIGGPREDAGVVSPGDSSIEEDKWWQYRDEYPDSGGEEEEEVAPPDIFKTPDLPATPGWVGVYEEEREVEEPEDELVKEYGVPQYSWWDYPKKYGENVRNNIQNRIEAISDVSRTMRQQESPVAYAGMMTLAGVGFGLYSGILGPGQGLGTVAQKGKRGVYLFWDNVLDLEDEIRQLAGFTDMAGLGVGDAGYIEYPRGVIPVTISAAQSGGYANYLREGNFDEYFESRGNILGDADTSAERLDLARRTQEVYNQEYNKLQRKGAGPLASYRAINKALKYYNDHIGDVKDGNLKDIYDLTQEPTGEYLLPFTDTGEEAWELSKYWRWTHDAYPEEGVKFWDYIESGINPEEAAILTTRPFYEFMAMRATDPYNVIPLDNIVMSKTGIADVLSDAYRGLGDKILNASLKHDGPLSDVVTWAMSKTAVTHAKKAGNYTDDAMRTVKRYADSTGQVFDTDFVVKFFDEPPREFVAGLNGHYRTALIRTKVYHGDSIKEAAEEVFSGDSLETAMRVARNGLRRTGIDPENITDEMVKARAVDSLFDEFRKYAGASVFSSTLDEIGEVNPTIGQFISRRFPQLDGLWQGKRFVRSTMVESWMGVRTSWTILNHIDNSVKLIMGGVDPFDSIADNARRYRVYNPVASLEQIDESAEFLENTHFWNMRSYEDRRKALKGLVPAPILQDFAAGSEVGGSKAEGGGLLSKTPFKHLIDWNDNMATWVEQEGRTKAYYHYFFKHIDEAYPEEVENFLFRTDNPLSDDTADLLKQKLRMLNPTREKVEIAIKQFTEPGELTYVKSNLGVDFAEQLNDVPDNIKDDIVKGLQRMVVLGDDGPRIANKAELDDLFGRNIMRLLDEEDAMMKRDLKHMDAILPEFPDTPEDVLRVLVPEEKQGTMEGAVQAVNDFPLLEYKFKNEQNIVDTDFWQEIRHMKDEGIPRSVWGKKIYEHAISRADDWDEFIDFQAKALSNIQEELNRHLDEPIPGYLFTQYIEAAQGLNDFQRIKYENYEIVSNRSRSLTQPLRNELWENTTKYFDDGWEELEPRALDSMHRALVSINEHLAEQGVEVEGLLPVGGMHNVGWDLLGDRMPDVNPAAWRRVDGSIEQLTDWYEYALGNRADPYSLVELSPSEKSWIMEHGDEMINHTGDIVDNAIDNAIERTNHLLFDYDSTRNLESLLGEFFPFFRYKSRNLPLNLEMRARHPRLFANIAKLREVQATINLQNGVPERAKYTVAIPYSEEFFDAVGLWHIGEQRIDPWRLISFLAVPGSTPYQQQQLQQLAEESEQAEGRPNIPEYAAEYMQQLGFGDFWPFIDNMFGLMGLKGDDWYPNKVAGNVIPITRWAVNNVVKGVTGEYPEWTGVEDWLIKKSIDAWNSIFGTTGVGGQNPNVDKFLENARGRKMTGNIQNMDDDLAQYIYDQGIDGTFVRQQLEDADPDTVKKIRIAIVRPLFEDGVTHEERLEEVQGMGDLELAVMMDELSKKSLQQAITDDMLRTLFGNTVIHTKSVTEEEEEARALRYERRMKKESLPPGEERRDTMRPWYDENFRYGLITTWRFSEHPFSDTEAGREIEMINTVIQNGHSDLYAWKEGRREELLDLKRDLYLNHPGEYKYWEMVLGKFYDEGEEYVENLEKGIKERIEKRFQDYIRENPNDVEGIRKLREGWEEETYVGVHLTDEDREQLEIFRENYPNDEEGYRELYQALYNKRSEETPPIRKKFMPGLEQGIKIDFDWSPIDDPDYTEEEQTQYIVEDLLRELSEEAPERDDYNTSDDYWEARQEYFDNLGDYAMKTDRAQEQVDRLVEVQGMDKDEAVETVKSWYTEEKLYESYKRNDTVYDAINTVYRHNWMDEADDEYYDEIRPIKEEAEELYNKADAAEARGDEELAGELRDKASEKYDEYNMRRVDLEQRFPATPARDLIRYIQAEYPGRWTTLELRETLGTVDMPGYFDYMMNRKTGKQAISSQIQDYYYDLPAERKADVRDAFGSLFPDFFLEGQSENISPEQLVVWAKALANMYGEEFNVEDIPGLDMEIKESGGRKSLEEFGLPPLTGEEFEEFEEAQKLNHMYWNMRRDGEEGWEEIEENPLYRKYFKSSAQSYFWDRYYKLVPPGGIAKSLTNSTLIQFILDTDTRYPVATRSDFDKARKMIEEWYAAHQDDLKRLGLDADDFETVRRLQDAYFDIPEEQKEKRKAFLRQNPLLQKYWDAELPGTDDEGGYVGGGSGGGYGGGYGGGGGGGSRSSYTSHSREYYEGVWKSFRKEVGQSLPAVVRMLSRAQQDGEIPSAVEKYLRSLYDRLDVDMEFEDWLDALWFYYRKYGTSGTRFNVPSRRRPSFAAYRPRYGNRPSGMRRLSY